jgi:hypothetical protein
MREFRRIKNKNYIYIFEITKQLNFNQHQISYFNNLVDIKEYIKHTFIAKSKNEYIGRTELKFDYKQKEQILKLFDNFKIKNYGTLTLEPFTDHKTKEKFYKITQSKNGAGNFIKITFIEKQEQSQDKNKYIEKYLFKYLLKQKTKNTENEYSSSLDTKVCKIYNINQLTYSQNFFSQNISSKILFKLNDKFHSMKKYLNLDIDNNLNLYHTIEFLESGDIYKDNNIYYFKNKENIVLDLNKKSYTKQTTKSTFESLYNKYTNNDNIQITTKESFIYLATQMFFIYKYNKKEIFKNYGVDTIENLAELFKLEDELYKEEQESLKLLQLEELYKPIIELDYQLLQITDNLITEADIQTINLINSKLENLQPSQPYQYF